MNIYPVGSGGIHKFAIDDILSLGWNFATGKAQKTGLNWQGFAQGLGYV